MLRHRLLHAAAAPVAEQCSAKTAPSFVPQSAHPASLAAKPVSESAAHLAAEFGCTALLWKLQPVCLSTHRMIPVVCSSDNMRLLMKMRDGSVLRHVAKPLDRLSDSALLLWRLKLECAVMSYASSWRCLFGCKNFAQAQCFVCAVILAVLEALFGCMLHELVPQPVTAVIGAGTALSVFAEPFPTRVQSEQLVRCYSSAVSWSESAAKHALAGTLPAQ